ncbi:nuclear transport factor 2 family protein [Nocardia sp. alder85J]|uniref:nuclear transport factor 2 family protein n=1 Tax=Nocardia sp. alder85J TaxID=2862949 RepID=UPI001CD533CE|nr:nuclear transport factor 2 family protein [Nocardia sp. alder85J]MCX4091512.1 nuclear transport factor 2 family protein [Nocardia sp. alder85J]
MTPAELFAAWGAAWLTRDPAERLRRFEQCCTEDVEFVPPDDRPVVRGRAALARHVTEYTRTWPAGVGFELTRPPDTHHDYSRGVVRWTFPSATAVGCDIIRIERGRIASMLVFAEP